MRTRAQGGYVDPGWGEKAKTSPTDQKEGQDKETKCETETTGKREDGKMKENEKSK